MAALAHDEPMTSGERLRTFLPSLEERKGLLLSHLLGFILFSEFALNVLKFSIPFTPANSIPIRLLAIWLLLDRTWRVGRLRLSFWDYLMIGFVVVTAIGMVVTAYSAPQIPVTFEDFRRFAGQFLNGYIYYLVTKEAINRRGFRPDIAVKWLIAGLAWSALVGIMQTLGLFGARRWSLIYSGEYLGLVRGEDSSLASGTAPWWNSMALEMLVAFALVFSPVFLRKPKWYEWALGMLYVGAFIGTQSRGGLLAFFICIVATFIWYVFHKRYTVAFIIGVVATIGVLVWLFAVFALKIERFTRTIEGEKVRGSAYAQSIDNRFSQQTALFKVGMRQPIFGIGPNVSYLPGPGGKLDIYSPYSVMGDIDGMYGVVFAQFGIVGLVFLLLMQGYMISFIRPATAYRPYAFAAFFIGVAFSVHGLVEFFLYGRVMIVLNVLAALASSQYLVSEQGRALFRRTVKMPLNRTILSDV